MIGLVWGLRELSRPTGRWGLGLLALQLVVSVAVAAVFFGTIRLRLPYDPFALVLALCVWDWVWHRSRPLLQKWRPGARRA
jgi:hypothetical protein